MKLILAVVLPILVWAAHAAEITLGTEIPVGVGQGNQYQSDLRINPLNEKHRIRH